jgi:hypothetical protein
MPGVNAEIQKRAPRVSNPNEQELQITAEEAADLQRARDRMLARHKLIESIIRNNEMQLRNESARGGAEIELECAKRDIAGAGGRDEARREYETALQRLSALREEHARLVAEREWLNSSLLEFDSSRSDDEHQPTGHA